MGAFDRKRSSTPDDEGHAAKPPCTVDNGEALDVTDLVFIIWSPPAAPGHSLADAESSTASTPTSVGR
jgi:hypothetical protein